MAPLRRWQLSVAPGSHVIEGSGDWRALCLFGCLEKRVVAGMQRSPGAKQKQKSRNLPCTCLYEFHGERLVPGVSGSVLAAGGNRQGQSSTLGCYCCVPISSAL